MVPRCRALRETLTSLRELSHFTREVYEAAADVCARAHDWPEAFKALQQLVNLIYPALAEQQAQQAGSSERQGASTGLAGKPGCGSEVGTAQGAWDLEQKDEGLECGRLAVEALDPGITAAALAQPRFRRWPEAAAALVLYFACTQQQEADTLTTMRQLPRAVLASDEVQAALRLRSALCDNNYVALFRLRAAAPPLVQLVTRAAAQRARESALAIMASAYRSIAVGAVCQALQLAGLSQLLACLKLLADRWASALGLQLGAVRLHALAEHLALQCVSNAFQCWLQRPLGSAESHEHVAAGGAAGGSAAGVQGLTITHRAKRRPRL